MKEAVIDASVAVKWVVEEEHSASAALLLQCERCRAPDHWQAEAVNALWSKVIKRELEAADAEERMMVLLRAPVLGSPLPALMPRAFALSVAYGVTIYDSLYVALAEYYDLPLVTADARLIQRMVIDTELRERIVWVGDLAAA